MTRQTATLEPAMFDYLLQIGVSESPLLKQLRQETAKHQQAKMQIAPEQGRLLAWLARLIGARRYLEIGVFTGYSSLVVAQELPPDGKVIACDISAEFTSVAKCYWKLAGQADKIELKIQPALLTLEQLIADQQHNSFDLAFIDADKPNTPNYYEACLQLVRSGGIIAIDNVFLAGRVLASREKYPPSVQILREFNQQINADSRVMHVTLPLADGITLLQKL